MPSEYAYLRELREGRKTSGLCVQCGEPANGYYSCLKCRQSRADRRRAVWTKKKRSAWRKAYTAKKDTKNEARRAVYAAKRAAGLCGKCGLVAVQQYSKCLSCRRRYSDGRNAR